MTMNQETIAAIELTINNYLEWLLLLCDVKILCRRTFRFTFAWVPNKSYI